MKKIIFGLVILIIIILVAGNKYVDIKTSSEKEKNTGPYRIGLITPLSDVFAAFGEEIRAGVMDAIGDRTDIELVVEDEGCEPAKAISAFRKLVDIDKVQFILGPACGSPQEAIAPVVKDNDVIVILPSAATRALGEISGGKIFNAQYSLEDESKFMAEKIFESGYKNVALVTYQNAFSAVHAKAFKENFKGTIVAELSFKDTTTDVSTEVAKLRNVNADAIYSTDTAFFLTQGLAKLQQYKINLPVFSQYAVSLPFIRQFVEGVTYSFPADVGDNGAIYELSKIAAQIMIEKVTACDGDYDCVLKSLQESDQFGSDGVRKESIILKKIVEGEETRI